MNSVSSCVVCSLFNMTTAVYTVFTVFRLNIHCSKLCSLLSGSVTTIVTNAGTLSPDCALDIMEMSTHLLFPSSYLFAMSQFSEMDNRQLDKNTLICWLKWLDLIHNYQICLHNYKISSHDFFILLIHTYSLNLLSKPGETFPTNIYHPRGVRMVSPE